jgi:hypothetical protein
MYIIDEPEADQEIARFLQRHSTALFTSGTPGG